jgi:hypothetical protein
MNKFNNMILQIFSKKEFYEAVMQTKAERGTSWVICRFLQKLRHYNPSGAFFALFIREYRAMKCRCIANKNKSHLYYKSLLGRRV